MREFASPGSRASALSLPARLLYTVFAALTLAGCLSCVVIYDAIVHFEARATPAQLGERLVAHYTSIDRGKLWETTHAHLFSMPVLLLVAGHLFLLSSASQRAKLWAIAITASAMVLHLLAPWVLAATSGRGGSAALYPITGGVQLLGIAILLAVPVYEMWRPSRRAPPSSEPRDPH
jgi:hypothetical protein